MENRRGDWESDALPLNDREYKNQNNIQKALIWIEKLGSSILEKDSLK